MSRSQSRLVRRCSFFNSDAYFVPFQPFFCNDLQFRLPLTMSPRLRPTPLTTSPRLLRIPLTTNQRLSRIRRLTRIPLTTSPRLLRIPLTTSPRLPRSLPRSPRLRRRPLMMRRLAAPRKSRVRNALRLTRPPRLRRSIPPLPPRYPRLPSARMGKPARAATMLHRFVRA